MTLGERYKVYDSFLPQDEYNKLVNVALGGPDIKWNWQQSNGYEGDPYFMIRFVDEDSFYNTHLFSHIQSCFDSKVEPLRIYFNAQTPNVHGCYHEDDGDVTAILYINQRPYEHKCGGWTELWDQDTGEYTMIRPLDNRLILFDAKLTHRGTAFLSYADPIRVNLTYKMQFVS